MAGYVIVESAIIDAERFEQYKRAAAPTVAAYGGRYLVRRCGLSSPLDEPW